MMYKPCKDCTKRFPACHDSCADYATYKTELQAINDERRKYEDTEYMAHRRRTIERQQKGLWR